MTAAANPTLTPPTPPLQIAVAAGCRLSSNPNRPLSTPRRQTCHTAHPTVAPTRRGWRLPAGCRRCPPLHRRHRCRCRHPTRPRQAAAPPPHVRHRRCCRRQLTRRGRGGGAPNRRGRRAHHVGRLNADAGAAVLGLLHGRQVRVGDGRGQLGRRQHRRAPGHRRDEDVPQRLSVLFLDHPELLPRDFRTRKQPSYFHGHFSDNDRSKSGPPEPCVGAAKPLVPAGRFIPTPLPAHPPS